MAYKVETQRVDAQFVNRKFVNKLAEPGGEKTAQVEGSAFIRQKLRQAAVIREVLPPVLLSDDEIDRQESSDQPIKIVEKEPDSVAFTMPFTARPRVKYVKGPRYTVRFHKVASQKWSKSKFELMTYQNDIRKILSDNAVKDMADQEDTTGFTALKTAVTTAGDVAAAVKNPTTVDISAEDAAANRLFRTTFAKAFRLMVARRRPIGKLVMSKSLYYYALNLDQSEIAEVAARHYDDGIENEQKLFGVPVVATIKQDIMNTVLTGTPDGDAKTWAFVVSPQEFLGNMFMLQDATLFIKQEADMVEFHSYESVGLGIGNVDSAQLISFDLTM